MASLPFWRTKTLAQMTGAEWESLCDGCGLCCLIRFEDEETGEITPTRVACRLFDDATCRCVNYSARRRLVPDCIKLTPGNVGALPWMPRSCAYRRLHEGKELPLWHPLISGRAETVHEVGASVRGKTFSEVLLDDPEKALRYAEPAFLRDTSADR